MKVGTGDACPGYAPFKEVLIRPGLIGLPVLLTENISPGIVARILPHDGELDLLVPGQLLVKFITEIDNASGVVGLCG